MGIKIPDEDGYSEEHHDCDHNQPGHSKPIVSWIESTVRTSLYTPIDIVSALDAMCVVAFQESHQHVSDSFSDEDKKVVTVRPCPCRTAKIVIEIYHGPTR